MRGLFLAASLAFGMACSSSSNGTTPPDNAARATAVAKLTGVAANGGGIYGQTGKCLSCHGADGKGQKEIDLAEPSKNDAVEDLATTLLNGIPPKMPSASFLTDQQIADVIAYLKATYGK